MKTLIIGSNGFIGSHLLTACQKKFETWSCDVVTDYEEGRYIQISAVNAEFHEIFLKHQFDVCINASGAASVPASFQEPLKDYDLNVVNVYKLLDSIKKYNPLCKFINLSSAAVYGNPVKLPIRESFLVNPLSPYGVHKRHAEEICTLFYNHWKLKTCSLRIFSAYGPGLTKQLFWDLYKKSLHETSVELFGTGNETRDFIYIDDLVNAIILVAEKGKFCGESINVANGQQWRIKEVAEMFFAALNWKGNISFINKNRAGDPLNWEADITLLKQMNYQQQVSMSEGISKYVQWLSERK